MPKAGFIVARISFLVLAASMLGVALLAAPAAGQTSTCSSTTKCFFAVSPVTPSNPVAGTNTSFTFTVKNEASPQQLGAVQISAPTGFMITGASIAPGAPGTASSTSSSALFTNLSVAPGSTVTLTVTATVPCGSGSYQWPIAAKQSNNFNGSGNDFQLDPNSTSNLSGTLTGSCTAAPPCSSTTKCFFAVSPVTPSNPVAGTNTSFTFTVKNEASPQQLGAVRISAPTGFMITGASAAPGAPGTVSFTSSSATFTNLSLASMSTTTLTVTATVPCGSGSYQWSIAATQSNNFNGSGNDFQLDPNSTSNLSGTATGSCTQSPPCPSGTTCSASASSSATGDSITVTTSEPVPQGDVVVAGIEGTGSGVSYTCPTYTSSPDVFSFAVYNASGVPQPMITLTVTVRIDKSVVGISGHPGASSWQACYASTTPFSANAVSGTYTASDSTNPPAQTIGGVPYNTGLLLGCPNTQGPPCVQSQTKNNAGDVLVTFLAPGDPLVHP